MEFLCGVIFEYDTVKTVRIKSRYIGGVYRLIQLFIIGYIIGYQIIYKKGYQQFSAVQGSTTSKVKGVVYSQDIPEIGPRLWDTADYIVPPQMNSAFFVTTNLILTPNQTQGECGEDPKIDSPGNPVKCTKDEDCPAGVAVTNGNGVRTGKCIKAEGVCQIKAWCPIEKDVLPLNGTEPVLLGARNFTVFIRNTVIFPGLDEVPHKNIRSVSNNSDYLRTCLYDKEKDPLCPVFLLESITKELGYNFTKTAIKGAVIEIEINWNCDLDTQWQRENCFPTYSFRRLDATQSGEEQLGSGYNFRYPIYYYEDKILHRDLTKAYGMLFLIRVTGAGGQFRPLPLILGLGATIGILAVASVVCDFIILYLHKKKLFFREKKYLDVAESDIEKYRHMEEIRESYHDLQ